MGLFDKIKKIGIFKGFSKLDDEFYDNLEESMILADMGVETTLKAVDQLRARTKAEKIKDVEGARECMKEILADMMRVGDPALNLNGKPAVVLFIGVNGVGKTTTIGKIGSKLKGEGKKVLFSAADTFRAAAAEQLVIWSERAGVDIVRQKEGADPAAVVFDSLSAAKARGTDVVLVDTAGRLHNKANLMAELHKLRKIIDRELPEAAVETLLVLDATTGQNGLVQAKQFRDTCGITGIVLTKLDGTAKGGIVIAIAQELQVPVKFVGLGEGINDMQPFDAKEYVGALI